MGVKNMTNEEKGYKILQGESVDNFVPNPWNPNTIPPDKFVVLVENIKEEGAMLQPVLATPWTIDETNKGKYMIIDGEHRLRASKEAGLKTIDAVIVSTDRLNAELKTLSFNNLRGVNDAVKMGIITDNLLREVGREVLMKRTGFTALEIGMAQGQILESMTSENTDKVESVRQALISVGVSEEKAKAMAEVAVVDKPILANIDIKGTEYGRTVPLTFYFDTQEQHDEVYIFFKKEKGVEPDANKLLDIVKEAKGVAV